MGSGEEGRLIESASEFKMTKIWVHQMTTLLQSAVCATLEGSPQLSGLVPSCKDMTITLVLPTFEDNGLPFWVPGVLCQRSEVVL